MLYLGGELRACAKQIVFTDRAVTVPYSLHAAKCIMGNVYTFSRAEGDWCERKERSKGRRKRERKKEGERKKGRKKQTKEGPLHL